MKQISSFRLFLFLVLSGFSLAAQTGTKDTVVMKEFLYRIQLAPRLHDEKNWTDQDRQVVSAHFNYLKAALKEGTLILAGRTDEANDKTFGLVVYKAVDEARARAFMEGDPAVKAGVMLATFHPFKVALGK